MRWSQIIRQIHRWVSIAFTLGVVANFVALGVVGQGEPVVWVGLLALLPLIVLVLSGLYLFALPYAGSRARGRAASG